MPTFNELISRYTSQSQMDNFFTDKMGVISVKAFGAKGDGATDDTAAVQAAIDAANKIGAKAIFFPKGSYRLGVLTDHAALTFYSFDEVVFTGTSYDVGNFSTLSRDVADNTAQLAEKTSWILSLDEYPRLSGEVTDSQRITRALNDMKEGDKLLLSGDENGEILIEYPIVVTRKNIQIVSYSNVTIKAVTPMLACIHLKSSASDQIHYGTIFENININANKNAQHGILGNDDVGQYISCVHILRVNVFNSLSDGFKIVAPAWFIRFNRCRSEYNNGDGIRLLTDGTKQINAISIANSFIQSNDGNGITVSGGAKHVISDCVIERNTYGIMCDPSLGTVDGFTTPLYGLSIEGNYMELNRVSDVYLKSPSSGMISGLVFQRNYIWNNIASSGSLIEVVGSLNSIKNLRITDNTLYPDDITVTHNIDGGGALNTDSIVESPITKTKNMGMALIPNNNFFVVPISAGSIQNVVFDENQKSENLIADTTKRLIFGLPHDMTSKVIRSVNMYVESDGGYTLRFHVKVKNLKTGAITKQTYLDISETSSSLCSFMVINNWLFERRSSDDYLFVDVEIRNATGTSLHYHIPYIEMSH